MYLFKYPYISTGKLDHTAVKLFYNMETTFLEFVYTIVL